MTTLLLRFAGPAQSYASSPFTTRPTEGVPTRSAVLGLIAAAAGITRDVDAPWLDELDIWVRVDKPGTAVNDFHTISAPPAAVASSRTRQRYIGSLGADRRTADFAVPTGKGTKWSAHGATTMTTHRSFLADAEFIVAITHPDPGVVDTVDHAIRNPEFMTYLGRKAFSPTFPFRLGITQGTPETVLEQLPTASTAPALPLHHLNSPRSYATAHVHPERCTNRSELLQKWRAA
ncbi:type I-E CRISPR-associated protein Cas5/CasD [Agromyces humi]|uniref:type I-E CRISPR-associated protein Cas5/CasD n=1 Tax=Agromyces humi TaxID=1766800 RepID=UPI001359F7B1|nr:type I-E CRISPR-associated protein Cas5/CasD [Agromyces humi]